LESPGKFPASDRVLTLDLNRESDGYFSGILAGIAAGRLYRFRLDGSQTTYPDPASRFQPAGPHGSSCIVDPGSFRWTDQSWPGVNAQGQVIYELHIGTFTREGTWQAAAAQLPELAALGITLIEVMPVADFPGRFGWGYDGVNLFAPTRVYGEPDDFRDFVNRAHAVGLGVILDVVYNHLGPDGNFLKCFADEYFTDRYKNEWGEAINFDGPRCAPVRQFFLSNAAYWIDEYHLDGLRLDATQQIFDSSEDHFLAELGRRTRLAAGARGIYLVAENEAQQVQLIEPGKRGGYGLDAVWNDDFHHSAHVSLTGYNEAYYSDFQGSPQELLSAVLRGFLYQGQRSAWQKKPRGTPTWGCQPCSFVVFLDNHDQVANSARGQRCHQLTSPRQFRALTALLLLGPATPMLFQGQEFAASSPFLFFADHQGQLGELVRQGRARFLSQFPSIADRAVQALLPDPGQPETFHRCKLEWTERLSNSEIYNLHKDLLKLRHEDRILQRAAHHRLEGAVLVNQILVLRYLSDGGQDRLILVNLGRDLNYDPAPEPLLAPVSGKSWQMLWSSEDPRYGGSGAVPWDREQRWCFPGHATVVLAPRAECP
jgi:maltooligosyltrehalose trehalohydrolase